MRSQAVSFKLGILVSDIRCNTVYKRAIKYMLNSQENDYKSDGHEIKKK